MKLASTGPLLPIAVFAAIVAVWAIPRLDGSHASARTPTSLAVAAALTPAPTLPATVPTESAPAAVPSVAVASNAASTVTTAETPAAPAPTATSPAGRAPSPPVTTSTAPPAAAADEANAEAALKQAGKAYLQAIISSDAATIAGLLSATCGRSDPAAILARRRADVAAEAGVPVETLVAIAPFVAHLDIPAGVAHTVMQFDARGERHTLPVADGWLLESGSWRSNEC